MASVDAVVVILTYLTNKRLNSRSNLPYFKTKLPSRSTQRILQVAFGETYFRHRPKLGRTLPLPN